MYFSKEWIKTCQEIDYLFFTIFDENSILSSIYKCLNVLISENTTIKPTIYKFKSIEEKLLKEWNTVCSPMSTKEFYYFIDLIVEIGKAYKNCILEYYEDEDILVQQNKKRICDTCLCYNLLLMTKYKSIFQSKTKQHLLIID